MASIPSHSSKSVLIAGLMHETHTFLQGRTTLQDFTAYRGLGMLSAIGDTSPLAGALETAQELDWHAILALHMFAMPSAMVEDRVIDTWWSEFEPAARAALRDGLDAIYLVLHGAMVSESSLDVEGEVLSRIRALVGPDILIAGVTDLHANFSERMAQSSDALVTYCENPHTDAKQAAVRAAHVLDQLMRTKHKPVTLWEHPPLMWPPTGTATADEPMKSLEAEARRIEAENPDILAVNVHAGFSFADMPDAGVSFTAITVGDPAVAQPKLTGLSQLAMVSKERGNVVEPPLEDVILEVKKLQDGPVILVEPSDNIGGGAPGDSTGVLRALVQHKIANAAVAINDPEAVAALSSLELGGRATLAIGGQGSTLSGGPITLDVELISKSNGRFDLEDAHSHLASIVGAHFDMGPCAVVRHEGIQILLSTNKTPPMDLGQLRSQGIVPESLFVIGVKAAVAHRRAYDPIAKASFSVDTPGPCSSNLKTLPFRHIKRPIYPLDEI